MKSFAKLALLCSSLALFGNFAGCCKKESETKSVSKKAPKKAGKKTASSKKVTAKKCNTCGKKKCECPKAK